MAQYEQSQTVEAPPDEVFAWLSDAGNLPKYLPPVTDASADGPSAEGVPGRLIRTTLEYPGEEGRTFDAEGYLAVDEGERRMERAPRPGVTTRVGSRSETTEKAPAKSWSTSVSASARWSRR